MPWSLSEQSKVAGASEGVRDAGQVWPGTPGELRSRPEISEGVRNAGRTPQKLVPGKLRRRPQPPRDLGKLQNAPLNVSEASEAPKHAAEGFRDLGRRQGRRWHVAHVGAYRFDAGEGWASISNSFQICPYIFAPDFYEQQNEESDEKNDVYGVLGAFRADSLCRR